MTTHLVEELAVFNSLGFTVGTLLPDKDSAEYNGCSFTLDHRNITYRKGKVTPTKNGQFVTLYKRVGSSNPIAPFCSTDDMDFTVMSVQKDNLSGHFIFPKATLCRKKIVTDNGVEGKRAFRIYPPWDIPQSKQAMAATQKWQLAYFIEIIDGAYADTKKALELYSK